MFKQVFLWYAVYDKQFVIRKAPACYMVIIAILLLYIRVNKKGWQNLIK